MYGATIRGVKCSKGAALETNEVPETLRGLIGKEEMNLSKVNSHSIYNNKYNINERKRWEDKLK